MRRFIPVASISGGSEALKIEQMGCNVIGGVAEGDVYCFIGCHGDKQKIMEERLSRRRQKWRGGAKKPPKFSGETVRLTKS